MSKNKKPLKIFTYSIEYQQGRFDVNVESKKEQGALLGEIIKALVEKIDPGIQLKTHSFEVFEEKSQNYSQVIRSGLLIRDMSVIRVSEKLANFAKCLLEFCISSDETFVTEVVVNCNANESQKYKKISNSCQQLCQQKGWTVAKKLNTSVLKVLETFDENSHQFVKFNANTHIIGNGSRLRIDLRKLEDLSVIERQSDEEIKFKIEFCDQNNEIFVKEVVVNSNANENQKYRKIAHICRQWMSQNEWTVCQQLKKVIIGSLKIFNENVQQFVEMNPKTDIITNGSRLRIDLNEIKSLISQSRDSKTFGSLKRNLDSLSIDEESEDNPKSECTEEDSLESQLKRMKISSSEPKTNEFKVENKTQLNSNSQKSRKKNKSKKKSKTRKQKKIKEKQIMTSEMTEYYLSLCLNDFLRSEVKHISQDLWRRVSYKLVNDCGLRAMTEFQCQMTFNELFVKYLNVLRTADNPFEASLSLKCFDLLNTMNFKELVTEDNQRLVVDLRQELWNRIKRNDSLIDKTYPDICNLFL